jgi:hypothetical protein
MTHFVRLLAAAAIVLASMGDATAQSNSRTVNVVFTPSNDSFTAATDEYKALWAKEGARIVAAMERATGLTFEEGPIQVSVYEGTSYSGEKGGRPMLLRASYPEPTKRATLVHELGHRLAADIQAPFDHHEVIFQFVYDVWVDLWGQAFADEQVIVESARKGLVDYEGIWKKVLAQPASERVRRFEEMKRQYLKRGR